MNKVRIVFLCFFIAIFGILVKLFFIQVIENEKYSDNNYLQFKKITPERGEIYDRNHLPLAINQVTYRLFAESNKIENKDEVIKKLDDVLHIGIATIESKITADKSWISVATNVTKDQKEQIEKIKCPYLGFDESYKRFYPEGSSSSHLLGFIGKNNEGDDTGYYGIEGYYQKDLGGMPGIFKTERDLIGNAMLVGVQEKLNGENGRNLILTIDKTIQSIVKEKLVSAFERYQPKEGCIIVADPNSMEILALTCLPDYDQSQYNKYPTEYQNNPAISSVYEPGSIFKPLIMAAALEEKAVKPTDEFNEEGPLEIGTYTIRNWDYKYSGKLTMSQILEKSSNIGMSYVGSKLGKDKLIEYLSKYGFGNITNIDLQGESPGYIKNKRDWYEVDYATATFGQGIVVTPIQMITAFSSLVNGGYLFEPHIVKAIESNGKVQEINKKIVRKVLSDKTVSEIKQMLENVVEKGEVKWAKPEGYRMGGKTGTAQIAKDGKYDSSKTIASFIGFAPYDNPKFVVLISLKEPSASIWGSETAAPIFFDIIKELLVYYNISP